MVIRLQDKVTNLKVLDKANAVSIEALLLKAQLHWTGCHPDECFPHTMTNPL